MSESIEAYKIGVAFVADATKVTGPIGEMLQNMDRILQKQRDVNMGFTEMVSSLGGARRLAGGLASDMERTARAARDIARDSAQFRGGGASGGGSSGGQGSASASPGNASTAPAAAPRTVLLAQPAQQITYDPRANSRTSTAGIPGNYLLGGPGVAVGAPYGGVSAGRPAPLLLAPPASTALTTIPGQGDSRGNGANFRQSGYAPNWTMQPDADEPFFDPADRESLGARIRRHASTAGSVAARGLNAAGQARIPRLHHALTLPEVFAGYMGWHVLSSGFEQAGTYDQTFSGLAGDPRANLPQLRALADTIRRQNPYINAPDSATLVSEAYDLSGGNMREAPGIASILSRADQAFQLMGRSGPDALRESANFIRAQDVSNRFFNRQTGEFDMGRANQSTDAALGMVFANRQFMNGRNFFQFARSAGTASQQMTDEGMFNLAHFIDVNPARAGNQVRSFENLFGGNHVRMTDKDFAYFRGLPGLVQRNGQFVGQQQLSSDPIGWITQHLVPLMRMHPELAGHIQRMNVGDLVNETYGASGNIARQAAADRRTSAAAAVAALGAGSRAAQQRTEVSWERFEFSLGQFAQGPGIQVLNGLTDALNRMSNYMTTHPDDMNRMGHQIADFAQLMLGASKIVGQIGTAIPSWLWPILIGAAGGGRVAGPWGAAVGAAAGGAHSLAGAARSLDHAYGYDDPNRPITWRDKLDPFQLFHTPQPTEVHTHVTLDGREIAHHVQTITNRQGQQSRRAQSGGPDSLATPQIPSAGWAH